jgi:hypothetical protein
MNTNDFLCCPCNDDTNLYKFWATNNPNASQMPLYEYLKKDGEETEKQTFHFFRGEGGVDEIDERLHRHSGGDSPLFISKKTKHDENVESELGGGGNTWKTGRTKKGKYFVTWGDPGKAKYIAAFCVPGKIHIYRGIEKDVERMFLFFFSFFF